MNIIISQIVLFVFLIANLIVGLRASRGVKTMDEYALANRKMRGGVLTMTLVATLTGVDTSFIKMSYKQGFILLMHPILFSCMALAIGWLVLTKLTDFPKEYSIAGLMNRMYGRSVSVATVILSTILCTSIMASQLKVFGGISALFGFNPRLFIIIMGITITIYTCLGGVRAVSMTDVLQFMVVFIGLLCFFMFLQAKTGGITNILAQTPSHHFDFWNNRRLGQRFVIAFFFECWPIVLLSPPVIQRVLMTQKKKQIRHMFLSFTVLYFIIQMILFILGLVLYTADNIPKKASEIDLSLIIEKLCSTSSLIQLLFLMALCAIIMSTVDSFINALAIIWVNDILKTTIGCKDVDTRMRKWLFGASIILGTLTTLYAVSVTETKHFEILGYGFLFFSVLTIPFVAGVLGLKGSVKSFWVSIVAFALSMGLLGTILHIDRDMIKTLLPYYSFKQEDTFKTLRAFWYVAIAVSAVAFFLTHYIEYGGFSLVKRNKHEVNLHKRYRIKPNLLWLTNPMRWANEKAKSYGIEAYLFGIFMCISFFVPWGNPKASADFTYMVSVMRMVGMILVAVLLAESIWPKKLRHSFFHLYYYLTLLYTIPVINTMILLNKSSGQFAILHVCLGMMLMSALVDWRSFLLLQTLGSVIGVVLNRMLYGNFIDGLGHGNGWWTFLGVSYTLLVALIFLRKKQLTQTQHSYKLSLDNATHRQTIQTYQETQRQLTSILHEKSSMMTVIEDAITKLKEKGDIDKETKRIEQAVQYFQEQASISHEWLLLKVASVDVTSYLKQVVEVLEQLGMDIDDDVVITNQSKTATLTGDQTYLVKLLVGGVMYLHHRTKEKVYVSLEDVALDYDVPDQTPSTIAGLRLVVSNEEKIPSTETVYYPMRQQASLVDVSSLEMVGNLRIIQAHYGMMQMNGAQQWGQVYVIPTDLKALRPKIAYFAQEDLTEETSIDSEVDKAFLSAVREKEMANLPLIKQALRTAKYYHKEQYRKSGEPFYEHPVAVATILLDYTDDATVIVAALLHDTVEDTPYTLRQLEATFGYETAVIVDEVTHLHSKAGRAMKLNKKQSLESLLEKENPKSLLVKLADRLHNMRTLGAKSKARQIAIAQETLLFFVPVAQRLKLQRIEEELKQLAAKVKSE